MVMILRNRSYQYDNLDKRENELNSYLNSNETGVSIPEMKC